jgi:hypothetical protein
MYTSIQTCTCISYATYDILVHIYVRYAKKMVQDKQLKGNAPIVPGMRY